MLWVTATDLKEWAERTEARAATPHLIRRLIEAGARRIESLEFPVGQNIGLSGFDGTAHLTADDEFVPDGVSVWEVSVEKNVPKKAVDDLNERSGVPFVEILPLDTPRSGTTYVGVSIRPWPKRRKQKSGSAKPIANQAAKALAPGHLDVSSVSNLQDFVQQGNALKVWKEVRMLDGLAIERWLEKNPAVALWMARTMGKIVDVVRDFEGEWDALRLQSSPVAWTQRMLLAGRQSQAESMRRKLLDGPSVSWISADSVDEGVAFAIATVLSTHVDDPARGQVLAKGVVVKTARDAEALSHASPLVFILRDEAANLAHRLAGAGHTCIAAIGRANMKSGGADIEIRRAARDVFARALTEDGMEADVAFRHARDCNGSPTILRRRVAHAEIPHWADGASLSELAAVALIGMFDADSPGDRECVEEVSGVSAAAYLQTLRKHLAPQMDAPLLLVQSQWSLYAPADILTIALENRAIDRAMLDRFASVAIKVLSERDPKLGQPPDHSLSLQGRAARPRYSPILRDGLSESLRLLATNQPALRRELGQSSDTWLDSLVSRCPGLSEDPYVMLSMGNMLSAVAEVAPHAFLDALETLLRGKRREMQGLLFAESDDFFARAPLFLIVTHSLEVVSWLPDLAERVIDCFVNLAELDPGGRLSNRPLQCLAAFFLPWSPATNTSVSERSALLLRVLGRATPALGWSLLKSLLPGATISTSGFTAPQWRSYDMGASLTNEDLSTATTAIVKTALATAGREPERWRDLVGALTSASATDRATILHALSDLEVDSADRPVMWNILRNETSRNARFFDADWALSENDLLQLQTIAQAFAPLDVMEKHRWLFDNGWPDVRAKSDDEDEESARLRARTDALREIMTTGGLETIVELALRVQAPGTIVGPALDILQPPEALDVALQAARVLTDMHFLSSFSAGGRRHYGERWADDLLDKVASMNPSVRAAILAYWDNDDRTLAVVAGEGAQVESAYWAMRPAWFGAAEISTQERIAEGLVRAGRALEAVSNIASKKTRLSTPVLLNIVITARNELAAGKSPSAHANAVYHIVEAIRALGARDDVPEETLVQLEFEFLRHLVGHRSVKSKLAIHGAMARTPSLYSDVIEVVYRGEKEVEEGIPPASEKVQWAEQAYRLLDSFSIAEGSSGAAVMLSSPDYLEEWVSNVRARAIESDRRVVVDLQLGKLLATSDADPDDTLRPHLAVRKLLEKIDSDNIERGFVTEVFNQRGVYSKGGDEGGDQERALASKWSEVAKQYVGTPRMASLARKVAAMWMGHARDEDMRRDKLKARADH